MRGDEIRIGRGGLNRSCAWLVTHVCKLAEGSIAIPHEVDPAKGRRRSAYATVIKQHGIGCIKRGDTTFKGKAENHTARDTLLAIAGQPAATANPHVGSPVQCQGPFPSWHARGSILSTNLEYVSQSSSW